MTHVIGDAAFVGDTIFMPDSATARSDFPGGGAATLFQSIHKILGLPPKTQIFMCHDYSADESREVECLTKLKAVDKADFVEIRQKRDRGLAAPPDFAFSAGEYARRTFFTAGRQRRHLSKNSSECARQGQIGWYHH